MIILEYIEGIILKKLNYKESSKIIYLYTDKGLISVLIHGNNKMKSPFLSLSKVLSKVGLHVSGKDLRTLRDGDVLDDYRNISSDLEKYTYSLHVLEIIYYFSTHEHDHEKLYSFLLKIFSIVDTTEQYIPYLNMIELKLLYMLGINPMFHHCVECDRTDNLKFSVPAGGMCCNTHLTGQSSGSDAAIEEIKKIYYFDLSESEILEVDNALLKEIRLVIDKYYQYHLNFKSNSRKMLMGLIGY